MGFFPAALTRRNVPAHRGVSHVGGDCTVGGAMISDELAQDMAEEIRLLKGAMAADSERLRDAERLVWGEEKTWGCDAPEHFADLILELRARVRELECKLEAAEQHVTICQRVNTEEVERRRKAEENGFFFLGLVKRHAKECPAFDDQVRGDLRESEKP